MIKMTFDVQADPDDAIAISIELNGADLSPSVSPRRLLSDLIREDCGLVGTHVGCGEGACGACTVLMDGHPVRSCTLLAVQADGTSIRTVEGLNEPSGLTFVQSAFQHHHALQCGFCTPGILATVTWMLEQKLPPDDATIVQHLSGHLCRCTGYKNILAAVRSLLDGSFSLAPISDVAPIARAS
jgi:aerobic-type carbon monoxide dehydrogenase small subunit (CoxS/CutS family)